MSNKSQYEKFIELYSYLDYTLHELPAGVLYVANGANEKQCKELMEATYELENLSVVVGEDVSDFLAFCRWHYERYAHYLSRHSHFANYAVYIDKYNGPRKI
ncbi:hypothetical protein C7Y70_08640 [Pseudoalteromonas sp. KS88]|uniref:hypothetical protein n=1 Tax=Pseudoalteromonas sp. KS88 TaxID=2109918 RepID=UPI0010815E9A|nr:hypothetical protein [Pseudoalteromonas sp. KS88]TGE84033.1 hypothetical protein C7Y70_08640 [Pseudoalteromonas sp. KS88]